MMLITVFREDSPPPYENTNKKKNVHTGKVNEVIFLKNLRDSRFF